MKLSYFVFVLLSCFVALQATAQIHVTPIEKKPSTAKKKSNGRESDNTLTLPIFEDFSDYTGQPDELFWENSEDVLINDGYGVNPPSLNVATFDGLKGDGSPHDQTAGSNGITDILMTCKIDLINLSTADNVYLSFFYQFAGLGDMPDASDSIRLEFFAKSDSIWTPIWPRGNELDRSGEFKQIIIPVAEAQYFNDSYRFRFVAYGRQSGSFDVWNLDYIFMNTGRSSNDNSYPDRTIATPLTSVFGDYTAIPRPQFNDNLMGGDFTITNLDIDDGVQPYTFDLMTKVTHWLDSVETSTSYNASEIDGPRDFIDINEIQTVEIPNIIPDSDFMTSSDSTILEYEILLNSDDEKDSDSVEYENLPITTFTINDFHQKSFKLKDYYAYDDGTAEAGAAVNFSGNKVAFQYEKLSDQEEYLFAFDIYFPFVNTSPDGKSIDLIVWKQLDNEPQNELARKRITISTQVGLNKFTRFLLEDTVSIENSTFFIGYRQNNNGYLSIGLDKNNDNGDKLFFDTSGNWEQNTQVKGSLMIRPVFGIEPTGIVTAITPDIKDKINIFPNPVTDIVNIIGDFQQIEILSIDGRVLNVTKTVNQENTQLNLSNLSQGIYILKLVKGSKIISKKIIKQ